MKSFNEWMDLRESVTFSIQDWQPSRQVAKNISDLGYSISSKLMKQFGKEYETGDMQHIWDKFTMDGYDVDAKDGTMNFYSGGMDEKVVNKIIEAIKYYLKEYGAKLVGPIRQDKSGMFKDKEGKSIDVVRFPVQITETIELPPELNVANRNAEIIVKEILQIPGEYYNGTISARDLLMKTSQLSDFAKGMLPIAPSTQEPSWQTRLQDLVQSLGRGETDEDRGRKEKGVTNYDAGLSEDQINRYLEVLENMAKWAMEHDYDYISWG